MVKKIIASIVFFLILSVFMYLPVSAGIMDTFPWISSRSFKAMEGVAWAAQDEEQKNIEWFKQEMKISPKYLERKEGILGMSWDHFFTMVFLVLFGSGAFILFMIRFRRTRDILKLIKEEKAHESQN